MFLDRTGKIRHIRDYTQCLSISGIVNDALNFGKQTKLLCWRFGCNNLSFHFHTGTKVLKKRTTKQIDDMSI